MIKTVILTCWMAMFLYLAFSCSFAAAEQKIFRLGMIGLDTSHVPNFTRIINDPANNYNMKVIYAYKGGSPTVPLSADRVDKFTKEITEKFGVQLVDSIEQLCEKVDGVLLESVDGRQHLEQIRPVLAAQKPVFIDKPMAASLEDVLEIFRLAKLNNVPVWSSSCLRYGDDTLAARSNPQVGQIYGCDVYGECPIEDYLPDMFWYGIHGAEALFSTMGPGLKTVTRIHTEDADLVVGVWKDGRIGTYRGIRRPPDIGFGGTAFGEKKIVPCGENSHYEPLCQEIVKFFQTGKPPVEPRETIEIFAFMAAAEKSKLLAGATIDIDALIKEDMKTTIK